MSPVSVVLAWVDRVGLGWSGLDPGLSIFANLVLIFSKNDTNPVNLGSQGAFVEDLSLHKK